MSRTRSPIVTIDGPSGSGKGTISRAVARRTGWHLLDSGALYRLVALAGATAGLESVDERGHGEIAASMDARFGSAPDGSERVWLDGRDVTEAIRSEGAGQGASRVAAWPAVRAALLGRQRAFARSPGLVADGRDMGTVVFPGADLKIFLTATPEERALRQTRPVAPLRPASDACVIDSTGIEIEAIVGRVLELMTARRLWP
ncbi:MAG: (d)CMP kinase [Gammaproteobacteria bacterium]|nr:MAG: (d)CMP kinase [Gammaproteobacteria bacterium]